MEIHDSRGVRGSLHMPEQGAADGLVLTHGAGGNQHSPLLIAVADALASAGITVLRFDLPFRQKRPNGPPHPSGAAADREGLRAAADYLRTRVPGRVFLGGQSYGGRQASMLAAEVPDAVDALLLLSYPLHPPGKPENLRVAHFAGIRCPTLFIHGSRDPFATFSELKTAIAGMTARTEIVEVPGAGHDLARGKFDLTATVVQPLQQIIA